MLKDSVDNYVKVKRAVFADKKIRTPKTGTITTQNKSGRLEAINDLTIKKGYDYLIRTP